MTKPTIALTSKLFLKIFITTSLLTDCGTTDKLNAPSHKCQAVVVLDKTNSVSYTGRLSDLERDLTLSFEQTYATATNDIQSSRLIITGNTGVFPKLDIFGKDCPNAEEETRESEEALQRWKMKKRKWIADEVKLFVSLIGSPCNSDRTDIFPIFNGIQQVQKNNGPWDRINVFIFSDMTNTCKPINMLKDMTIDNAREKGKTICQHLIDSGLISAEKTGNLYLTIYTPDKMENAALVNQFWKGFFERWGLPETHYHFE